MVFHRAALPGYMRSLPRGGGTNASQQPCRCDAEENESQKNRNRAKSTRHHERGAEAPEHL